MNRVAMEKMQESLVVRQSDGTYIKKGPWTAEEDDILNNFVNKYGPRDWSSIRSKGLLPRTGKSCRLRWVNKLRPNLKTCKFTAEEERVVIELQAQFGNKWAKIATYLPGRTDNDVKNFWSTRRKRLERMLQNPSPRNNNNNKGKNHRELVFLEVPESSSVSVDSSSCNNYASNKSEELKTVPFPDLLLLETNQPLPLPVVDPTPFQIQLSDYDQSTQNYPFSAPALEPQLMPDCPADHFFGFGADPATLDSFFFEDFPDDVFDHLPSPSEW